MNLSIPFRYSLPTFLITGALIFGYSSYYYNSLAIKQETIAEAKQHALESGRIRNNIEYAIQRQDFAQLESIIADLGSDASIDYGHFIDNNQRIIASTRRDIIGDIYNTGSMRYKPGTSLEPHIEIIDNSLYSLFPVSLNPLDNELRTSRLGFLIIQSNLSRQMETAISHTQNEAIQFSAILICLALIIWAYIHFVLQRRIQILQTTAKKIGSGNLDTRVTFSQNDEISDLANSFNKMAEKLESQHSHLQALQTALDKHAIVSITDIQGNITFVNDKFCEITQYTQDELLGQNHRIIKSGAHSKTFYENLWLTISSGKTWQGVIKNRKKDNSLYWVQSTIVPIPGENNKPAQYISVRTDVTQRERMRQAMGMLATAKAGEESFDTIAMAICTGLNCSIAGFGRLIEHNKSIEVLGLWQDGAPAEKYQFNIANSPARTIFSEAPNLTINGNLKTMFPNDPSFQNLEAKSYRMEPMLNKGHAIGVTFAIDNTSSDEDESQRALLRLAAERATLEVTRAEHEQAIQETNKQTRAAQRMAHLGSWTLDFATDNLSWTEETYRIFEIDPQIESASYETFVNTIHPDDRELVSQAYQKALDNKTSYSIVHRLQMKDGRIKWVHERGETNYDPDGKPVRSIGYVHDISDQVESEAQNEQLQIQLQQAQKMESIGQLTGGIAHDFNNILASMLGYTKLSQQKYGDTDNGKLGNYLQEVVVAGQRATELVTQMLSFGRSQPGQSGSVNASEIIGEVTSLLDSTLPSSISLEIDTPGGIPPVLSDPVQLHQILTNLIINARDAISEHGKISISLKESRIENGLCTSCHQNFNGDYIEISVKDDGKGISEEAIKRIFEPFFTTKKVGEGSGMGLAMVHGIVHQYMGHVIVDTDTNQGANFRLLLPLADTASSLIASASHISKTREKDTTNNQHIMLVDDEQGLTDFLSELLQTNDYQVTAFNNPVQAQDWFESNADNINLVITDQTMPHITGVELAQSLLKTRPELPIILCTGYSASINEADAYQYGIAAFMKKPFDNDQLLERVAALINNRR